MASGSQHIRICILSCQHPPDDSRVTHRLGRSLVEQGFEVTWVGPQRQRSGPDYGITFHYYPSATSRAGRFLHPRRLCRAVRVLPPQDVYLAVEPDSAMAACALARRTGARVVFDIHEIYHGESLLRWVPRLLLKPVGFLVRQSLRETCRRCDLVIAPGRTRIDPYCDVDHPSLVLRHCLPRALAPARPADVLGPDRDCLTVLHGKATMGHGTRIVLEALAQLKRQHGVTCRVIMFRLRSDAARFRETPVEALARELGVRDQIDLRDATPFEEMLALLAACDAGVIAYDRDFGVLCLPNRVFEYMAAGLPVVVPSYAVELQPLLARYRCGVACDMEQPEALAGALLELWQNKDEARAMGRAGRKAFEDELNWETEVVPLVKWIRGQGTGGRGQETGDRGQETGDR